MPLPFNDARFSGLSAGVPGTVRGWDEALEALRTMSLAEALQPAIKVAREGFVIDQTFFDQTLQNVDFFDDVPSTARAVPRPGRHAPRRRHRAAQPRSRARLRADRALGTKGFYRGAIADAMVEAVQHPPVAPTPTTSGAPG